MSLREGKVNLEVNSHLGYLHIDSDMDGRNE